MNTQPDTTTLEGKIAVMQAAKDGKRIQLTSECFHHRWQEVVGAALVWNWESNDYRIHPDDLNPKKLRPWKPEEVPIGCLVRQRVNPLNIVMATGRIKDRVYMGVVHEGMIGEWKPELIEHSTDNGATWKECGVWE